MLLTTKRSYRTTWQDKPVIIVLHYDASTLGYSMAVKEAGKYNRDMFFDPYNSLRDHALQTGQPMLAVRYFEAVVDKMGIKCPQEFFRSEDYFNTVYGPDTRIHEGETVPEEIEWMKEARDSFPPDLAKMESPSQAKH